jgi:beta-lactamase superfamily II metal-dependent hydrolase
MFLPVGQGLFCCERFFANARSDSINIVFDCGSDNKGALQREIDLLFHKGETIHAVFVSHVHEDHVSGLPLLLKRCRVLNIYYPLIEEKWKNLLLLFHNVADTANSFPARFLADPSNAVRTELGGEGSIPALHVVHPGNPEEVRRPEGPLDLGSEMDVPSGVSLALRAFCPGDEWDGFSQWIYVPFNFRAEKRRLALQRALDSEFGPQWPVDGLTDSMKTKAGRDKVRKAYRKVSRDLNINSMTLFSGILDTNYLQAGGEAGSPVLRAPTAAGCLYTGDYKAKGPQRWGNMMRAYARQKNFMGCIQIPHHGARGDFNDEITNFHSFFVVSAGLGNSYCHPHPAVVDKFQNKNLNLLVVTEERRSGVQTLIASKRALFRMRNCCRSFSQSGVRLLSPCICPFCG